MKLRAIIAMLVTIFLLGMLVNLIGVADKDSSMFHNIISGIILALHVLTAFGILVTAIQLIGLGEKLPEKQKILLRRGFAAVGIAFIAGMTTVATPSPWSDVASFIMAVGFIAGLILYGCVLVGVNTAKK